MPTVPNKHLETFPNPEPGRDYIIQIATPEFTCLCPKTGQPDFATLELEYVPDKLCVELKALKLYIWAYRDQGAFHEQVTNTILNDLVAATQPRYLRLVAQFNVRGGIYTTVTTEYRKPGWQPPPARPDHLPRVTQELPPRESAGLAPATPPATATAAPADAIADEALVAPTAAIAPPGGRFRMLRRTRELVATAPAAKSKAPVTPSTAPKANVRNIYIGIDLGTTGGRAVAIDADGKMLAHAAAPIAPPRRSGGEITQDPNQWWKAVTGCLQHLGKQLDVSRVHRIAVDGTSGTLLLCDALGNPVTPALMYNDQRAEAQAANIAAAAPAESGAHGPQASLAKLLWLQDTKSHERATYALHQAEWVTNRLIGSYGHGDYNNALKLGFDLQALAWPAWLKTLGVNEALLPRIYAPGDPIGTLDPAIAQALGLSPEIEVVAGTTDGVAAFLAAGATQPGQAVTVLGTTLVLKLLSTRPVTSPAHGAYSHRLGTRWLAGGASNSGGAVLLQYFSEEQLRELTPLLNPETPTDLDYYPLPAMGERFPINDPEMMPRIEPLPGDSAIFLQGLFEGIARIEAEGYRLLAELGAPAPSKVWTIGGGSRNPAWTRIRERALGVKIETPRSEYPAYGAALLAGGIIARNFA